MSKAQTRFCFFRESYELGAAHSVSATYPSALESTVGPDTQATTTSYTAPTSALLSEVSMLPPEDTAHDVDDAARRHRRVRIRTPEAWRSSPRVPATPQLPGTVPVGVESSEGAHYHDGSTYYNYHYYNYHHYNYYNHHHNYHYNHNNHHHNNHHHNYHHHNYHNHYNHHHNYYNHHNHNYQHFDHQHFYHLLLLLLLLLQVPAP
ncbi:hypothetical protein MRX96_022123 [Rhipicephalus microplus]